jgi:hypothetical protein
LKATTFSGLFSKDDATPRGSKRLNGTNDNVETPKIKRKRSEAKIDTPAVIMGTGDIESDLIAVQPLKWLYVSMLHPETTEDSIVKLLGKKLNKTENDFTCVKLVPKNIPTLTFISFKVGMSEELFEKSIDPTVWPNGVAIREFVNRPRKFFRQSVARIPV